MFKFMPPLIATALFLAGCAGRTPDVYKGYSGAARPSSAVATVRAKTAFIHAIDDKLLEHPDPGNKYYVEAHLPPGSHSVNLQRWFGVSVLIVPKGYIEPVSTSLTVNMEAGRVYELHGDRTTGRGFRVFFWIEDATTGAVVAGDKLKCPLGTLIQLFCYAQGPKV